MCHNTLALSIEGADEVVLGLVEEVLGTRMVNDLLALVEQGEDDPSERLTAERDRLRREVSNLLDSVGQGIPAASVAGKVREREQEIARLEAELRRPRPPRPDVAVLRDALLRRSAEWKATLRSEPKVARVLVRRMLEPLTLWVGQEPREQVPEWMVPFETAAKPEGLLVGLEGSHPSWWRPQREITRCGSVRSAPS